MMPARKSCFRFVWLLIVWLASVVPVLADTLSGINGERFIGKVVEETADTIVFESQTAGRLTVPRSRIRGLERDSLIQPAQNGVPGQSSSSIAANLWQPPTVGKDGADWIQLKSGEWLKGRLDYVQTKKVQFESDELEDQSFKLKDVRRLYSGKPMFTKFTGRDPLYGSVVVSNEVVEVIGPEQVALSREQLEGITRGGSRELEFWSGKADIGLELQSGNTKQTTMNANAELARRTPATQFLLDYLGTFNEVEGTRNANNHRVNLSYDIRLTRHWFVRPVQLEYYRDPLANIAYRITAAVGAGYYILDRDNLDWKVAAGPGYQVTRFETVTPGEADSASTPAATIQTRFKADLTKRLTFIQSFAGTLVNEQSGLYTHHSVSTLEYEIKRYLDLDVSFVWDYLQNPQPESSGEVPERSDLRLTLGLGVKF